MATQYKTGRNENNTGRISNKEKILDALKKANSRLSTSEIAGKTGIDIKNISRYLSALERSDRIERETVQNGKKRFVYVKLVRVFTSRNEEKGTDRIDDSTSRDKSTSRKKKERIIRKTGNIHTPERNKNRLYDIYYETDSFENLANKYDIPIDYINKLKSKLNKLKYPPKIKNGNLVCYQCGKGEDKRLVFHHNHEEGQYIALVCDSCNQKLENNESVIKPLLKKEKIINTGRSETDLTSRNEMSFTSRSQKSEAPAGSKILTVNSIWSEIIKFSENKSGKGYERINKILRSHDKNRNYQSNIIRDFLEILIEIGRIK